MTMMPSTTFQIVITESWVIENAAMSALAARPPQRGHIERLSLQPERKDEPVEREVADPSEDAFDPVPQLTEDVRQQHAPRILGRCQPGF